MAKRDAQKKGGVMAKEWWKSRSNEQTIEDLVAMGPFLQGLCLYYEIGICNLHPNSILLVSTFIHLCEAYGGFLWQNLLNYRAHMHMSLSNDL